MLFRTNSDILSSSKRSGLIVCSVNKIYFRERHQLPDEHGSGQDCIPTFRVPDGPVEMESVRWTHTLVRVQQGVVEPQVEFTGC